MPYRFDEKMPYSEQLGKISSEVKKYMKEHDIGQYPDYYHSLLKRLPPIEKKGVAYLIYITHITATLCDKDGTPVAKGTKINPLKRRLNLFCGRQGVTEIFNRGLDEHGETHDMQIMNHAFRSFSEAQQILQFLEPYFPNEHCKIYTYKISRWAASDYDYTYMFF